MQYLMTFTFYATSHLLRPWRVGGLINRMLSDREETQLDQFIRTKRNQFVKPLNWLGQLKPQPRMGTPLPDLNLVETGPDSNDVLAHRDQSPSSP